jgi:hypothetical protein
MVIILWKTHLHSSGNMLVRWDPGCSVVLDQAIPWRRDLFKKLLVLQLIEKFFTIFISIRVIIVFTKSIVAPCRQGGHPTSQLPTLYRPVSRSWSRDLRFSKQIFVSVLQTYSVKRRYELEETILIQISRTKNVFKVLSCMHWVITALSSYTNSVHVSMFDSLGGPVIMSFNSRVRALLHSRTRMAIKSWEMANCTFIWFNSYMP